MAVSNQFLVWLRSLHFPCWEPEMASSCRMRGCVGRFGVGKLEA